MTLLFPDVSQYTPNVDPSRYPALLARATLSDRVADPTYQTFKAKAAGKPFAAYHWLNHGNLRNQAAWCFQHVGPGVPVMIDAEDVSGNTGYAGPLSVDDLLGFTQEYRALGGIVSLVYLPFWYWAGPMSAPHRLGELAAAGLGLVSSNYPNAGYTDNGPGWAPYYSGAPVPVQWQYTSTPIDMNAFRGTVAEFAALLGGTMTSPLNDAQARQLANADQFWYDIMTEQDPLTFIYAAPDGAPLPLSNLPLQRAKRIEQKLDDLAAKVAGIAAPQVTVDVATLKAALQDPAVLKAVAKAVNDDAAARLQS